MWTLLRASLLLLALGAAHQAQASNPDMCFPDMPMTSLNHQPDLHMRIFTDYEFSCGGEIVAWNIYAARTGHFYASVWRKYPDGRYEMIGKNYVEATKNGKQTYFIPRHLRFRVKAGDMVGIHYDTKSGKSVVKFRDNTRPNVASGITLSKTISDSSLLDADLTLGHTLRNTGSMKENGKRAPGLFPVFNRNRLRLDGGANAMEGRAMFLNNGEWGTICDGHFSPRGWPLVFCKELGYDHCEHASFAKKEYTGKGSGPIGYIKPACPLTGNIFMDDCGKDSGTCGHSDDVFVRCAYATKLDEGKSPREGRAMAYKGNNWGTICDKNPNKHEWPSTLCNEIGFKYAQTVRPAKDAYTGKGSGTIHFKNPTCDADKPYHLKYCAKSHGSCTHSDDVFVKCQLGVRLEGGINDAEGVAQIYKGGQWGTVCMDTIERAEFPSVFCKDMGYERVDSVVYARSTYVGSGSGHIADMNPSCNPSNAANVLNCGHPSENRCGHNKDIFIRCANNDKCSQLKPCQHDAVCIDLENDYKCECPEGYKGKNCEQDIDDCANSPCAHGSTCVDKVNGFECKCPAKRTGDLCEHAVMPTAPCTIKSYDKPTKSIYSVPDGSKFRHKNARLSEASTPFRIVPGLNGQPGFISFKSVNHRYESYLRDYDGDVSLEEKNSGRRRRSNTYNADCSFYPEEDASHPGYYRFRSATNEKNILVHTQNVLNVEKERDNVHSKNTSLFYLHDLDEQDAITLYDHSDFSGRHIILTTDDSSMAQHGFNDKTGSLKVKGSASWQLFSSANYEGDSVIVKPGEYTGAWLDSHIRRNKVSSVRKVTVTDGIIMWKNPSFTGEHTVLESSDKDLTRLTQNTECHSIEVVGPSSWEVYSSATYKGDKVVLAPGRYPADWVNQHIPTKIVRSARKVEVNGPMCGVSSGSQKLAGNSGAEHDVFVVHREDGSAWLRFGIGNQESSWTQESSTRTFKKTLLSDSQVAAMKDFTFIGWEVHTDVNLQMSVDNSWHPSKISVMYLGSRTSDVLTFADAYTDRTDITFAANKARLACTGRVQDGRVQTNLCGQNGLPEYGSTTNSLAITEINMRPKGRGFHAQDRDYSRNACTWRGSYYYVYAKLANCATSSGCFKRESGMDFVFNKVQAKQDNRPDTFYFGQLDRDIDACEAACKDEPDCVAYTLFSNSEGNVAEGLKGGCYGIGKANLGAGVRQAGAHAGLAVKCGSFIPEYMRYDMWTRNTTGCPCSFDTSRTDCACCYEGACQCESRYKYQCTLCGFNDRCGSPFLTTESDEYIFEYSNQQLTDIGRHYMIPGICVTGCHMKVRGANSAANKVTAYMTDFTDNRVLSCVASDLASSTQAIVRTDGITANVEGSRISRINMYSFGGVGEMIQLRLQVKKGGCPEDSADIRYVGCFDVDTTPQNGTHNPVFVSSHMTRSTCLEHCYNHGSELAKLRTGTTCECAQERPLTQPSFTCDTFCSGDSAEVCGGRTSESVFRTHLKKHTMVVGTAPGNCANLGGEKLGSSKLRTAANQCHKLTGVSSEKCDFDLCGVNDFVDGGLFFAKPGSCGSHKKGEVFVRTTGADCIDMGGQPNYESSKWGDCKLDVCTATAPSTHIYSLSPAQSCPAFVRLAEVEVNITVRECQRLGGVVRNPQARPTEETYCQFEMCVQDKSPKQADVYTFPHNNEVFEDNSSNYYSLPKMCVTECQFSFKATSDNSSNAMATLLGDNQQEVGLVCKGRTIGTETSSILSFAEKATGVFVSGLQITARRSSFVLENLLLRTDPNGCKDDENVLVLYDKPNFGGRPRIIKEDLADLATVRFNNRASSFKIYGEKEWGLYENKDYQGQGSVLTAGAYYDTSLLPFGDNALSSVKMVGKAHSNMEQTRKDISNAKGVVCFKRTPKTSTVFGLPPNTPEMDDRPEVFYFGKFGDDIDVCERQCRDEPQCAAFTLFSTSAQGELAQWRGLCYGRSFTDAVEVYQEDVISGLVASCAEEDTITLYAQKEYVGHRNTITDDVRNITMTQGPLSALVTGKDVWRILTESDGHVHTYTLSPGEYSDLSATITGTIFQVYKMNPSRLQLYKQIHNQIDLAPVAYNQIEKTITEIRTKISGNTTTETVCNTTNEAEIFFIMDASGSVGAENYDKTLDFAAKVVESFELGDDKVRVGAMIFAFDNEIKIPLGAHKDTATLQAALRSLEYTTGGTYTDDALKTLREQALNDANCRKGVSRQAILITDGKSRWPTDTAKQAHLARDAGIVLIAVGIKGADADELHDIAGDASRVYNIAEFDQLSSIIKDLEKTTCEAVTHGSTYTEVTQHVSITVQGDDTNYFVPDHTEFTRKPVPLGMESGVIYNKQIFASSSLQDFDAHLGRLNHNSGWKTTNGSHTNNNEWIEIDLGKILPIHGISTQGHGKDMAWVTKYKIAISLDGIHFVTFKDLNTTTDLIFIANEDQSTTKYHCLHRLFGIAIKARVIRFIVVEWHTNIAMRIELYGYREADDSQLIEALRKDVWTRNVTGCPCYYDANRKDCACCEDGGCQCANTDRHQCVQCGYPHMCGTPNLRNPVNNIDGWTSSLSGCRCTFDPLRTDCACCQSYGCQCGSGNKNQCVNCGHPEHCGLKEHIFGPNPYCKPQTCPKKINTIWEGEAPTGVNPGDQTPPAE